MKRDCLLAKRGDTVQSVRKYRSLPPLVGGLVGFVGFLLLGVSMLAFAPSGDVGDRVFGACFIVLAGWGGGLAVTNGVVLSPLGVTYRYNFRRKTIAWESVASLDTRPMPGLVPWFNVVVELQPSGRARIASIVGTRRQVRRVISEWEVFRAQFSSAPGDADSASP
jgi:Bacterial PH domain